MPILLTWLPVVLALIAGFLPVNLKARITGGRIVLPVVNAFIMFYGSWLMLVLAVRLTQPEDPKHDLVLAAILVAVLFGFGVLRELWQAFRNNRYNAFSRIYAAEAEAFRYLYHTDRDQFIQQAKQVRFNRENWWLDVEAIAIKLYTASKQSQTVP